MGLLKRPLPAPSLCRTDNYNNSDRSSRRIIPTNEAPYQMLGKKTLKTTLGYKEITSGHFWLSLLSECLSCYLYVFIVCSTRISWTGAIIGHEPNLLAMALSSGITMMLLIFTFRTVHVNPALTISFLLTGRISIVRGILYILVHCLSAIAAIAFLYSISIKGHAGALGLDNPHDDLNSWQILIVEIVISFIVTLTTYATCNYSSYTCAKRYVLEQLGQTSSLFQPCDNNEAKLQRHPKHVVAPIVPKTTSTSINLLKATAATTERDELTTMNKHASDLINVGTNKPFLIGNHYNQVYDDYNDSSMYYNENLIDARPNQLDSGYLDRPGSSINNVGSNSSGTSNNISGCGKTTTANNNAEYNNGGQHIASSSNHFRVNAQTTTRDYPYQDNNYDCEYDNHRIYASQRLKSEESYQVPIEETMQDECQLLAPNGFSLHVTTRQALVIGLAYTLTSLTGIPASGASLNPARSFGPAFIMNRWDRHWVYWLGPILGAVIAGFFYEFIFSPTRSSSLCYRPKLFRLSAHDMAKVGSKTRSYQRHQQQQRFSSAPTLKSTTIYRPQPTHQQESQRQDNSARTLHNNTIRPSEHLIHDFFRDLQSRQSGGVANLTAHLNQPPHHVSNTFDQVSSNISHLHHQTHNPHSRQQQQQQFNIEHLQTANFDRSKSSALINSIIPQQQQQHLSSMNLPQRSQAEMAANSTNHLVNLDRARTLIDGAGQAPVYDNPQVQLTPSFAGTNRLSGRQISATNRRSLMIGGRSGLQQASFEFGMEPGQTSGKQFTTGINQTSRLLSSTNNRQQFMNGRSFGGSSINANMRPHSLHVTTDRFNMDFSPSKQQQQQQSGKFCEEQLDDDLYNVLSETQSRESNHRSQSNEISNFSRVEMDTTCNSSDSSQSRTNELINGNAANSNGRSLQLNNSGSGSSGLVPDMRHSENSDNYYNQ